MYATNRKLSYEIYQRAKTFSQRPSDVAVLDECVTEIGRFYFDRGVWAFGERVLARMDEVSADTRNPSIAQTRREREWERLMGEDMSTSATGFADPSPDAVSAHGRVLADDDDGDEVIELG